MTVRPFEDVVTEHGPTVLRVCLALLGRADAEDACAETFLAALRAYPRLRAGSNVRGWLVTIAHRKAIDHLRAKSRAPQPRADLPDIASAPAARREPEMKLYAALLTLSFKQHAAVTHHYMGGLSYAEVGALLGTTEAAARRSAFEGIASLRRQLENGDPV